MSLSIVTGAMKLIAALAGDPEVDSIPQSPEAMDNSNMSLELHVAQPEGMKLRWNVKREHLFLNSDVQGFVEINGQGDDPSHIGLYSKTKLFTPVTKGFGIKTEAKISNNNSGSKAGIGVQKRFEVGESLEAYVKVIPLWFDTYGYKKDFVSVGAGVRYQVDVQVLDKDYKLKVKAFGSANVVKKTWDRGEVDVSLKRNRWEAGVGVNLQKNYCAPENKRLAPKVIPRGKLVYHF